MVEFLQGLKTGFFRTLRVILELAAFAWVTYYVLNPMIKGHVVVLTCEQNIIPHNRELNI